MQDKVGPGCRVGYTISIAVSKSNPGGQHPKPTPRRSNPMPGREIRDLILMFRSTSPRGQDKTTSRARHCLDFQRPAPHIYIVTARLEDLAFCFLFARCSTSKFITASRTQTESGSDCKLDGATELKKCRLAMPSRCQWSVDSWTLSRTWPRQDMQAPFPNARLALPHRAHPAGQWLSWRNCSLFTGVYRYRGGGSLLLNLNGQALARITNMAPHGSNQVRPSCCHSMPQRAWSCEAFRGRRKACKGHCSAI